MGRFLDPLVVMHSEENWAFRIRMHPISRIGMILLHAVAVVKEHR